MTDKWLSELMGGDSWGWRGRAQNSAGATTPPDDSATTTAPRNNGERGKATDKPKPNGV